MMRSQVKRLGVAAILLAFGAAGCSEGGIEEGMPKDTTYKPPVPVGAMKPYKKSKTPAPKPAN